MGFEPGSTPRSLGLALLILMCQPLPVFAEPAATAILAAIRENGERLQSGHFTARGVLEHRPFLTGERAGEVDNAATTHVEESLEVVFDHQTARLHFARIRSKQSGTQDVKTGNWSKSVLILSPDVSIQVRMNRPDGIANVTLENPVAPESAPGYFQPVFDARSIPLTGVKAMRTPFADLMDGFERTPFQGLESSSELVRLRADMRVEDSEFGERFDLWVDPAQGHQPIRYSVTQGKLTELDQAAHPVLKSETSWSQRGEVWVPETVDLYSRSPRWEEQFRLALVWHSVNEPVPDSWFRWEELELPKGTQVGDRSVVDGVIVPVAILGQSQQRDAAPARPQKTTSYWMPLVLANVILFGVLLGIALRKRAS